MKHSALKDVKVKIIGNIFRAVGESSETQFVWLVAFYSIVWLEWY